MLLRVHGLRSCIVLSGLCALGPELCGKEIRKEERRLCPMERVKGIEPSHMAWEANALPLSYTRLGVFYHILGCAPTIPVGLQSSETERG